jgi:proline iminopeptidase
MKKTLLITLILATTLSTFSEQLYIKTFGDSKHPPILFLHGGPGYNCANFEGTTAQQLADKKFFVIVYDRRGEGRSIDIPAKYTFEESFSDINSIVEMYHLKKLNLIGHSFGGILATKYAEAFPANVNSIILVGAPIALQESFKHIISKSKEIYQTKQDSINLKYIQLLTKMDTASIEYSTYCFGHAMQNGFYTAKKKSEESKALYANLRADSSLWKFATAMTYPAPTGFWTNEKYTTLDLTNNILDLQKKKINIFGLYGKEDGLYSEKQINSLSGTIGGQNIKYLDNCSHNVFIDQQKTFIESIQNWIK